jgi:gluconolactonase
VTRTDFAAIDPNGMIFNHQGELVVCEGAAYRISALNVRTGEKRVLAHEIDGQHFNEPNDLAVDFDGGVYFTDPNYSHRGQPTVMKEDAYYVDAGGKVRRVSTVCQKPNGILLSPDGGTLYLADARGQRIYRYRVTGPGQLADETLWLELDARPDGMTLDERADLYLCCGQAGVKVYSAEREPLGVIEVPYASNTCFGGPGFTTLFITSSDKFLGIPTRVRGILPPPLQSRPV